MYPIVFIDALRVKIRDAESRQVTNKAVYVAPGVNTEGEREVLGLWIANNEGAKFWLSVMNNLRNRGVEDILIAVVDGLNSSAFQMPSMPHSLGPQSKPALSPSCVSGAFATPVGPGSPPTP